MAFRLVTPDTITGDIALTIPGADKTGIVKMTFAYQTAKQHDTWRDRVVTAAQSGTDTMTALLAPVITGWGDDVLGADDKPVPYSVEALDDLLDKFPAAGSEIYRGYTKLLTESRVKN
jgi:Phage tail assembly chaperone